jgi:hypothetical protein
VSFEPQFPARVLARRHRTSRTAKPRGAVSRVYSLSPEIINISTDFSQLRIVRLVLLRTTRGSCEPATGCALRFRFEPGESKPTSGAALIARVRQVVECDSARRRREPSRVERLHIRRDRNWTIWVISEPIGPSTLGPSQQLAVNASDAATCRPSSITATGAPRRSGGPAPRWRELAVQADRDLAESEMDVQTYESQTVLLSLERR